MSAQAAARSNGSDASPASGRLECLSFKPIKIDTPRGRDFLTEMAREIDRLHARFDRLFEHLGIAE